jgi:uncharacterized membrane protein YagU involved in acid resistance
MNIHEVKMSVSKATHDRLQSVSQATHDGLEKVGSELARVGRGTLAGLIAGAFAAYVMNRYVEIESRPARVRQDEQARRERGEQVPAADPVDPENQPTVKVAQKVSRKLFDHELGDVEKKAAGPVVHYGYAAAVGALYGGLAEIVPGVGAGLGVPYAALLWLGGDEIALPALGLTDPPHKIAAEKHVSQLATHFVYGLTLDIGRRILRRLL